MKTRMILEPMNWGQYQNLQASWGKRDWAKWDKRVQALEVEGLDRSDAQGATDCEYIRRGGEHEIL